MATRIRRKRAVGSFPTSAASQKQRNIIAEVVPRPEDMGEQLSRIAASNRTAFEKKVWTLLCQIPPGFVSTYGLMASHLNSSPRAVGNALRRNPFAPQVPCHRVVATGGALGGFKGHPSKNGEGVTIGEKKLLLRNEGVKIDERGRVLGTPWDGFVS
ncbi:RING-2-like protein [Xylariaceae sp. AK1471]|nr:RING-2-like protein [Xylariaceae sp. AK1471]